MAVEVSLHAFLADATVLVVLHLGHGLLLHLVRGVIASRVTS